MKPQHPRDPTQSSYIGTALGRRENQVAAVVTLLVAAAVALFGQHPLPEGTIVDLRRPAGFGLTQDVIAENFWEPGELGRWTVGPKARLIFNRPFARRGTLVIKGFAMGEFAGLPVGIRVGRSEFEATFGDEATRIVIPFENPDGSREIQLDLPLLEDATADVLHGLMLSSVALDDAP